MPLDNSGTKMVLNRYGNLITTKDRTNVMQNDDAKHYLLDRKVQPHNGSIKTSTKHKLKT